MPPVAAISSAPDHVAVAVPVVDDAPDEWHGRRGGRWVVPAYDNGVFVSRQLRFGNGAKLELLAPSPGDGSERNFVRAFMARFGSGVHHVTLAVPDLRAAIATVEDAGLDVVDVDETRPVWHEAFLRPSQVGGLVVQIAWRAADDAAWARSLDYTPEPPEPAAHALLGPTLHHPDLDAAARVWTLLGAEVAETDGVLTCAWPDAPLTVRIEAGEPAGPVGLRFAAAGSDVASTVGECSVPEVP